MNGVGALFLGVADFFSVHGMPTIAGFFGGIAGGLVYERVRNWIDGRTKQRAQ